MSYFRDVHLLSRKEVELYYQICSKSCLLLKSCSELPDTKKGLQFRLIFSVFTPFMQLQYVQRTSTDLGQVYPESLFNFSPLVFNTLGLYFCRTQDLQASLDAASSFSKENLLTDQIRALRYDATLQSSNKSSNAANYVNNIHMIAKGLFGTKIYRAHLYSYVKKYQLSLPIFEKEVNFIL